MIFPKTDGIPVEFEQAATNQMLVRSRNAVWIKPEAVRWQLAQIEQFLVSKAMWGYPSPIYAGSAG